MAAKLITEVDESLRGQDQIWKYLFSFGDSMAVKCAIELRIPDIIHSHKGPITLSQIASSIADAPSPNLSYLNRVMRLLVRRGIFSVDYPSDGNEEDARYGPTDLSRWLLVDTTLSDQPEFTLAPIFVMENNPWFMHPWHSLSQCIREGGLAPFEKAFGEMFDFAGKNPEFNKLLNEGMACTARITIKTILSHYGDVLFGEGGSGDGCQIRSVVDVGGGTGSVVSQIVKAYPHIKGINFDRPHVITVAPKYPGVTHIAGDMFQSVPSADAVFMKVSTLPQAYIFYILKFTQNLLLI